MPGSDTPGARLARVTANAWLGTPVTRTVTCALVRLPNEAGTGRLIWLAFEKRIVAGVPSNVTSSGVANLTPKIVASDPGTRLPGRNVAALVMLLMVMGSVSRGVTV